MHGIAILLCLFLTLFPVCNATHVQDLVVAGTWTIRYLVLDPEDNIIPASVSSIGFSQTVQRIHRGYMITVTSSVQPIPVPPGFQFLSDRLVKPFDDPVLIQNLSESRNAPDALRTCLDWLDRHIVYSNDPHETQDVETVLQRGTGNCVGRSETLSKLLHMMGLNNRTIRGCLFQNGDAVFHRWIEVDYPGIGSLPTEPGSTQDFVTPHHLVLLPASKITSEPAALSELQVSIRIIEDNYCMRTIDFWPGLTGAVAINRRQTDSRRFETAIVGDVAESILPCSVELAASGSVTSVYLDGKKSFSFIPVRPGPYHLSIRHEGRIVYNKKDSIRKSELVHLFCSSSSARTVISEK